MTGKINREFDNYLAVIQDLASGAPQWQSRPSVLEFALNNVCNLRCVMCEQSDGLTLQVMPKERAATLLAELGQTVTTWMPMALSEPLANDPVFLAEHARKNEMWLTLYTNGMLLTAERFSIIADRLDRLFISMESHVKSVLEGLRVRAKLETLVDNIKAVMPLAHAQSIPIVFVAVLMADTAPHLADFVDFLANLGAAQYGCTLRVQRLLFGASGCAGQDPFARYSDAEIAAFLDRACERAQARKLNFISALEPPFDRGVHGTPPPRRMTMALLQGQLVERVQKQFPGFCNMATHYLKVNPDGAVFPCCRAPLELHMGNVNEQSVDAIWNGPRHREFRQRMFDGNYPITCRNCDVLVGNPAFKPRETKPASN